MEMLRLVGSGLGTGEGRGSVVRLGASRGRCWGRRRSVRGVLIVGVGGDVDAGERGKGFGRFDACVGGSVVGRKCQSLLGVVIEDVSSCRILGGLLGRRLG
jgi:hypothetical protein